MCGIVGFIDSLRQTSDDELEATARRMALAIRHRGPDDEGAWVDPAAGLALAFRRLSIVDLSPQGHQPMISACGRYVIAFNGEIYNFGDLRHDLDTEAPGLPWRGHSDTEVMLAAISRWGLDAAIRRFNGMFAFAVWDRQERSLHLVRDRLGKKPLYYGWMGTSFLFGSELKALAAHPSFEGEVDRDVLALFLRHNYVPNPYSIYRGIKKLPPATMLTLSSDKAGEYPAPIPYWSARQMAEKGVQAPFQGSEAQAIERLDELLRDAVRMRMVADVPLGAFLSGGIDSSLVVALMQAQSPRPVRTFTIGFNEADYNEAEDAGRVARHLGTDHTELYVTPEEARAVIPRLPEIFDEPFSDSSQIPTLLVSEMARRHVTVSLSGDGGDELFGGYNRYFWAMKVWSSVGWMPRRVRQAAASAIFALSPDTWGRTFHRLDPVLPGWARQRQPGDKLHRLAGIMAVDRPESIYRGLVSHWKEPASMVLGSREPPTILSDESRWANVGDFTQGMMYLDTVTYLPDDILTKVDRASMAVSLEARAPLLDYRVMELAWQLPPSMKIRDGRGKWILRELLYRYVPREMIDRPKMGFGVPIDSWLRGPLRDWAESLLDERRLREEGFLDPAPIRRMWAEHLSGRQNWQYYLWDILMFQAWLEA